MSSARVGCVCGGNASVAASIVWAFDLFYMLFVCAVFHLALLLETMTRTQD